MRDPDTVARYALRDGYTIYCTPTLVEDPSIPNL